MSDTIPDPKLTREEAEMAKWILSRSSLVQIPTGPETPAQGAWAKLCAALNADPEPPRYTLAEVRERLLRKETVGAAYEAHERYQALDPREQSEEGWMTAILNAALDRFEQGEGER